MSYSHSEALDTNTDFDFADFGPVSDVQSGPYETSTDFPHVAQFESIVHPAPLQTSNLQTVSPKDIMVEAMSAPPSTTLTDLTTPGTSSYESPWMANSCETSPLYGEDELGDNSNEWPSLFPSVDDVSPASGQMPQFSDSSPTMTHVAPRMSRNGSSPGSRSSQQGRHSITSGVAAKRRDKPLPAITVEDPNDSIAVKRARNTMAARKSRQKRMEHAEQLEAENAALQVEVDHWKNIALSRGYVE